MNEWIRWMDKMVDGWIDNKFMTEKNITVCIKIVVCIINP
jgi:hypothetical protein